MTELNGAMVEAAEKAFDRIWMGAAYQGMAQDAIRAALTAALALLPEAEQGWQPIETARTDIGKIDLWEPSIGRLENWTWAEGRGKWIKHTPYGIRELHLSPTHWRPLPAPPPAEGGQKG